jgi:hypothetical protein
MQQPPLFLLCKYHKLIQKRVSLYWAARKKYCTVLDGISLKSFAYYSSMTEETTPNEKNLGTLTPKKQ